MAAAAANEIVSARMASSSASAVVHILCAS